MEAVAAMVLGVVFFMQAWQLFGPSQPKTTGIVGAAGAIGMAALVAWKPLDMLTKAEVAALSISVALWAIYAVLLAAEGLWGFDTRGFGLYSIFPAVGAIGQVVYSSMPNYFSLLGIICGIVNVVAFGIVFLYLGIPLRGLKSATAWVLVVVGVIHGLLSAMAIMKVPGLL